MGEKEITYQSKDVLSKILAENFKEKSLNVYRIDVPKIKDVLPTNLRAVRNPGVCRQDYKRQDGGVYPPGIP